MPVEPWVRGGDMLAKAQDNPTLVRPNSVCTAREPHGEQHPNDNTYVLGAELLEPQRWETKGCPAEPSSASFAKMEIVPCHGDAPAALRYPLRAWSLPAAPMITITEPL